MHTPEQLADALDRALRQLGLVVHHDEPITNHIQEWPVEEAEAYREHRFMFGARSAEQVRIDRLAAALHESLTPDPEAGSRHLDGLIDALGLRTVSVLADATTQEITAWSEARPHNVVPPAAAVRLESAAEALTVFTGRFGANAAQAWFTTPADWLDGQTPAKAIRGGQHRRVLTGARAITEGHLHAPLAAAPEQGPAGAVLRYDRNRQIIFFHTDAKYDVHILQPPASSTRWSAVVMPGTRWEETLSQGLPFRAGHTPALAEDEESAARWPAGTVVWDRFGQILHLGPDGWIGGHRAITGPGSPEIVAYPLTAIGRFDPEASA